MPSKVKEHREVKRAETNNKPKKSLQERISQARCIISDSLIERDEEVDLMFCALLAQKHLLLIGPPGTAKSLLVDSLSSFIKDSPHPFTVHCCKDTTRNAVFGPVKMSGLKVDKMERVLDGGAADSSLLILEECFKSGPAVLDMFLMLLNERVYKEGLVQCKTPLKLAMAVSNEWSPEGCETALAAFFDRFLFRKEVKYVSKKSGRIQLLKKAKNNHKSKLIFEDKITLEEVDRAHLEAMLLPFSDEATRSMWSVCEALDTEGVSFSDRRLGESVLAVRAAAYLAGDQEVKTDHLAILSHVLWDSPLEMPKKCQKIVMKHASPLGHLLNEKQAQAEDVFEKASPSDMVGKLKSIRQDVDSMKDHKMKQDVLDHIDDLISSAARKVSGVKE